MHFEILVEDQSGKAMLDILVPRIIGNGHTFNVRPYKGLGKLPPGLRGGTDPSRRILLDRLPKLLSGYGRTPGYTPSTRTGTIPTAVLFIVCDLDDRCLKEFRRALHDVAEGVNPRPDTRFCLAIEEGEAWLLGDRNAVETAYPSTKTHILDGYVNDDVCGTWECLADAVHPGGHEALKKKGWPVVGAKKTEWAESISPHIDIDRSLSPSFRYFCLKLRELSGS